MGTDVVFNLMYVLNKYKHDSRHEHIKTKKDLCYYMSLVKNVN